MRGYAVRSWSTVPAVRENEPGNLGSRGFDTVNTTVPNYGEGMSPLLEKTGEEPPLTGEPIQVMAPRRRRA